MFTGFSAQQQTAVEDLEGLSAGLEAPGPGQRFLWRWACCQVGQSWHQTTLSPQPSRKRALCSSVRAELTT